MPTAAIRISTRTTIPLDDYQLDTNQLGTCRLLHIRLQILLHNPKDRGHFRWNGDTRPVTLILPDDHTITADLAISPPSLAAEILWKRNIAVIELDNTAELQRQQTAEAERRLYTTLTRVESLKHELGDQD